MINLSVIHSMRRSIQRWLIGWKSVQTLTSPIVIIRECLLILIMQQKHHLWPRMTLIHQDIIVWSWQQNHLWKIHYNIWLLIIQICEIHSFWPWTGVLMFLLLKACLMILIIQLPGIIEIIIRFIRQMWMEDLLIMVKL